jgi:hypothetical protein
MTNNIISAHEQYQAIHASFQDFMTDHFKSGSLAEVGSVAWAMHEFGHKTMKPTDIMGNYQKVENFTEVINFYLQAFIW